ncbi:MAG: hypothetical protein E7308_09230 [Butyrivibrio sp.]|nr:hypothetical protein [Butyrivibrio sp.]
MDIRLLETIQNYPEVYEYLTSTKEVTLDQLKDYLVNEKGIKTGSLSRRLKLIEGGAPFISLDGEKIIYDRKAASLFVDELAKLLGVEQRQTIRELQEKIQENALNEVRAELERKVLVASSIKVGPKVHASDETFLVDPEELLDVDKCVAKYGGELDSFYEELPTDDSDTGFEPGHELTERNHALRIMKTVGTSRFFKKRINDNAKVKETEARVGQLFPGHGDRKTERQRERDKILHNRFISLNKIMESGKLTNQEKLMMYAMNSEYHNTHIERLLNYAGAHCINADYLIYILEDPDVCTTYENTVAFLEQFADASEFRMKLNLARELIEGKWYITADYNGRKTKFQLVPIEEINELREKVGLPASEFSYDGDDK